MYTHRDASTLTDVCNSDNIPEIEICTLVQEKIPKYKLRADLITEFGGCRNEDWIQTPILTFDSDFQLSPEIIGETLKYFALCGERVTQMTKAYHDIECVSRLLEEKERDLELAARIGQTLLEKNRVLTSKYEEVDSQLTAANEKINQLSHELSMKDELLKIYTDDDTDSLNNGSTERINLSSFNIDNLQKKLQQVEKENKELLNETTCLQNATIECEEKEKYLVQDCIKQLEEKSERVIKLSEELSVKNDESIKQQEAITNFLVQIADLQKKKKIISIENAELQSHLQAAQTAQKELTGELKELNDKYEQCMALLHDAQEDIKTFRSKSTPRAMRNQYNYSPFLPRDSLASELESSLISELDGQSPNERKAHNRRIIETAKYVNMTMKRSDSPVDTRDRSFSGSASEGTGTNSLYESSAFSDSYNWESADESNASSATLGKAGVPGSNDLETALRRLSLRRAQYVDEEKYKHFQDKKSRNSSEDTLTSYTPDSILSSCSRLSGQSSYGFRIPEKLQIVKPMEGSMTLHQWQRLATPNLGNLFDDRPGVQVKGEEKVEIDTPKLSDLEEDDDCGVFVGKSSELTSSTFTFTNSKVMHPSVHAATTSVASSNMASIFSSTPWASPVPTPWSSQLNTQTVMTSSSSQPPAGLNTQTVMTSSSSQPPAGLNTQTVMTSSSKRPVLSSPYKGGVDNATSTYSMSIGLASILNERGINARMSSTSTINTRAAIFRSDLSSHTQFLSPSHPVSSAATKPSINNSSTLLTSSINSGGLLTAIMNTATSVGHSNNGLSTNTVTSVGKNRLPVMSTQLKTTSTIAKPLPQAFKREESPIRNMVASQSKSIIQMAKLKTARDIGLMGALTDWGKGKTMNNK